eukprot:4228252-Pyramimonas_sp.AAC.1
MVVCRRPPRGRARPRPSPRSPPRPRGVEARGAQPAARQCRVAALPRRGAQRPPRARPQALAIMERSMRAKVAEESITHALRLEAPTGRTRHDEPSPPAIAEVILASSGWALAKFCVNCTSCARPTAG